ncbi:hypothetical protein G3I76_13045, partial [Streptomyces sp. SID11233]|nr:hypothetical protein [Streptomyces sp. SID11233]
MRVDEVVSGLPGIAVVRERCRAMAVLDLVLAPGGGYFDFFPGWGGDGVDLASMDDASGNEYGIVFTP